jgi:hypothetical protein
MVIKCYFAIIVTMDTIYYASSRNSLKFPSTFGIVHHVLLQHLDFYLNHAMFFLAQVFGGGGDTWEFHLSLLLCIVYICACISFWVISFYLWLVLIFLFSRVYYGFTPLWHHTSRYYMSRHYLKIKNKNLLTFLRHFKPNEAFSFICGHLTFL